eukprot:scaffold87602_cov27-Tisochrysis_lutea.AAC.6
MRSSCGGKKNDSRARDAPRCFWLQVATRAQCGRQLSAGLWRRRGRGAPSELGRQPRRRRRGCRLRPKL